PLSPASSRSPRTASRSSGVSRREITSTRSQMTLVTTFGGSRACPPHAPARLCERVVERRRGSGALGGGPDHALGATPPLWRRIPHGGSDESLLLESIKGSVEGTQRTAPAGCLFQLAPNGRSVRGLAQSRTHAEHQVLEFTKHDYDHIVAIIRHDTNRIDR